jgi:hypothetical protein
VNRKEDSGEDVDITIIPGEITPEKVTVPPEDPSDSVGEDEDSSDDE